MKVPPSILLPDFQVITREVSVGTSTGQILGSNSNRVTLLFWPRSVGTWIVGPARFVTTGQGFAVNFNSSPLVFDFATYAHLLTAEWWGISTAGPFTAIIQEVSYNPR